ncbi:MAG: hypothetical protein P4M14_09190 [Gammaproteobacteria bacterium]|nr:hypothetical protein [Gammaproteobacteria bacterium]
MINRPNNDLMGAADETEFNEEKGEAARPARAKRESKRFPFSAGDIQFFSQYRQAKPEELAIRKDLLGITEYKNGESISNWYVQEDIRTYCQRTLGILIGEAEEASPKISTPGSDWNSSDGGENPKTPEGVSMSDAEEEDEEVQQYAEALPSPQISPQNPVTPQIPVTPHAMIAEEEDEEDEEDEEKEQAHSSSNYEQSDAKRRRLVR